MCSSERSQESIPNAIQVFETYHNRYDNWFTRHQWVYRSEVEAVSRLVPQGGLGLEVGVGTGRFATPFAVDAMLDVNRVAHHIVDIIWLDGNT